MVIQIRYLHGNKPATETFYSQILGTASMYPTVERLPGQYNDENYTFYQLKTKKQIKLFTDFLIASKRTTREMFRLVIAKGMSDTL